MAELFSESFLKELNAQQSLGGVLDFYRENRKDLNKDQIKFFHELFDKELDPTSLEHQIALIVLAVEEHGGKWIKKLWNSKCYEACTVYAAWRDDPDDDTNKILTKLEDVRIGQLNLNDLMELSYSVDVIFHNEIDGLRDVVETRIELAA